MELTLSQLFQHAENTREYEPGEIIFAEGGRGDCMYALLEGEVAINIKGFDVWQLKPGEVLQQPPTVVGTGRGLNSLEQRAPLRSAQCGLVHGHRGSGW